MEFMSLPNTHRDDCRPVLTTVVLTMIILVVVIDDEWQRKPKKHTLIWWLPDTLFLIWFFPFQSTLCQDGWYKILSGFENYLVENIKLQLFLKLVQGRSRRMEGWAENYSRLAHPALSWASVSDQFNLQHPSSPPPPCSLLKPIPSPPHLPPHHNLICNILPPLLLPKLPSQIGSSSSFLKGTVPLKN